MALRLLLALSLLCILQLSVKATTIPGDVVPVARGAAALMDVITADATVSLLAPEVTFATVDDIVPEGPNTADPVQPDHSGLSLAPASGSDAPRENLDFTAFSKLAPTDFLQAVIKSGGTEADCRSFATTTISTISESVKSQGATLTAVDTGAACASEGQDLVQLAQGKLPGKQGVLATKQDSAKVAREAKTAACTAAVDMSVGLDTLTKTPPSLAMWRSEASFISADAACNQAKTAVTQADGAVDAAQTGVEDAQGEVDDAVAEAARLESGCLCRVHQEQADALSAVQKATASNAADWKQAQEVLCALDQTTPCSVPPCPTLTQPTLAATLASAGQRCDSNSWKGIYPETAEGCMALILADSSCNQQFFNYAESGDHNCGCIAADATCKASVSTLAIAGQRCDANSWKNIYPETAEGCMALILADSSCNQQSFNYADSGDHNCGCIPAGAYLSLVSEPDASLYKITDSPLMVSESDVSVYAIGDANADIEHCTAAPTESPTESPIKLRLPLPAVLRRGE